MKTLITVLFLASPFTAMASIECFENNNGHRICAEYSTTPTNGVILEYPNSGGIGIKPSKRNIRYTCSVFAKSKVVSVETAKLTAAELRDIKANGTAIPLSMVRVSDFVDFDLLIEQSSAKRIEIITKLECE